MLRMKWLGGAAFALGLLIAAALPATAQLGDFSNWYTIAMAAAQNKIDDVQTMLVQHKDPDSTDDQGRTALILAVNNDNIGIATLLLHYGAHVDAPDSFGNTALHWAALRGNAPIVKLLIAQKAAVDVQNRQGITPLMEASGNNKTTVVRLLLAAGADPTKQDYTGRDASGWAAGKPAMLQILAKR